MIKTRVINQQAIEKPQVLKCTNWAFVTDKREVTDYDYYRHLMVPVDLYKFIKQCSGKALKAGENRWSETG